MVGESEGANVWALPSRGCALSLLATRSVRDAVQKKILQTLGRCWSGWLNSSQWFESCLSTAVDVTQSSIIPAIVAIDSPKYRVDIMGGWCCKGWASHLLRTHCSCCHGAVNCALATPVSATAFTTNPPWGCAGFNFLCRCALEGMEG
jgi:hypothetical protein